MELKILNINGVNVDFKDQPSGLSKINIDYERDSPFNGFNIEAKATIEFYCASGYNELKAEYDRAFVDGVGYIIISETCSNVETTFKFNLDFTKYEQTINSIKIGLIQDNANGDLKDLLEVEKDIPDTESDQIYLRNIDVRYLYHSDNFSLVQTPYKENGAQYGEDLDFDSVSLSPLIQFRYRINPKSETTINELEIGNALNEEMVEIGNFFGVNSGTRINETASGVITNPNTIFIPTLYPSAVFENELEDGLLKFKTNGSTSLLINSLGGINFLGSVTSFKEIVVIGQRYEEPKYVKVFDLTETAKLTQSTLVNGLTSINLNNATIPTIDNEIEFNIRKGDNVWIFYTFEVESVLIPCPIVNFDTTNPNNAGTIFTPNTPRDKLINYVSSVDGSVWEWELFPSGGGPPRYMTTTRTQTNSARWQYNDIEMNIDRELDIEFVTNKNTNTGIFNNTNDMILGSTKITAYKASKIANVLFPNLDYNELEQPKYDDLYLTRGDILRNKAGRDKFRLNANKYFTELEKITGLGLGLFFDNSLTPKYRLEIIESFYKDDIFQTFSVDYDDLKVTVAENMLYKSVEIGYNVFKESFDELHGKNIYQIEGVVKGKSKYTKLSDWIASKFIIKKSLNLGSSSEKQEYDENLFILSIDSNMATISDNSASATIGKDLVFEQNQANVRGLNRKYASLYNLKRHELKWCFGIYKGKTDLSTQRNVNNQKEISYDDGLGYIDLPNFVRASNDITINDIDLQEIMIANYLEFAIPMNITEFSNLRKNWYSCIEVICEGESYIGNIITVNYSEGIANFKLLERI
jgi:hypothetical protein